MVSPEVWGQCERLLPHVLAVANTIQDQGGDQLFAEVAQKAAEYLYQRARYEQAEPLYQHVLRLREQARGPEHPAVAAVLNNLGILARVQGKTRERSACTN